MLPIDLVQKKERTLEQYIKELAQRTLDDTDAKKICVQIARFVYSRFSPLLF